MHRRNPVNFLIAGFLLASLVLPAFSPAGGTAYADSSTPVFINEIHYDNASTDVGEAVEIAGPAGTDLTGWSLVLYNGNGGPVYDTIDLSGTLPDQQDGYGTLSFATPGIQNGAPDGLALVDASNAVLQFLSYEGTFTAVGGPADGLVSTDIGVDEGSSTPVGDSLQLAGRGTIYEDFTWQDPDLATFGSPNVGQCFGDGPCGAGASDPDSVAAGSSTLLTVAVTPGVNPASTGVAVTCDLTAIGGSATQALLDDGTGSDATAGDNVFSYEATVDSATSPGDLSLPCAINDDQAREGSAAISLAVLESAPSDFVSIHDIQYTTDPSGDSPYEGETVTTEGVVTGFFYAGGSKYTFIQDGTGPWSGLVLYRPDAYINVGDELQVHGEVSEYSGLTEIAYGAATVLSSDNDLPAPEKLASGDVSQEQWESVLVQVENVRVTNPDMGYGEWQVDDGSGGVVVDDLGNYNYAPKMDEFLPLVQGPLYFSHGAFKIEPRNDGDIGVPIGVVQGSVGSGDDGTTFASPYAGKTVVIQGVIYEKAVSRSSSGSSSYAFFIQNTAATADGDPNSSDGIYVYIGYYSTLRKQGGGYYTPQVGDEVVLSGPISEYYDLTEISNPYVLQVVRSGVNLNAEVPAFDVNPPADLADANRYWERHEGMRGEIPAGSIVLNGRNVFSSTADAEVWVARPDSTIALRTDPYARRAFRDAHPLDDNYSATNWDGNGYRILMGSLGIKAAANDNKAMINPARTFDTLPDPVYGGLYYGYSKYTIQPEAQVNFNDGVDPSLNNPPQTFDPTQGYSIVDYNLENLYDYRNNPFSGCDFAGDSGCSNAGTPFLDPITPSFDYVPGSNADYQARLNDIALQIVNDLHSPDVLMVQEVENQDICTVSGDALTCGTSDNADGQPDVLQDLALKIASNGGPNYASAFDRDSSDLRGIAPAFMYRTDRVQLLSPTGDPILDGSPAIPGFTAVPYDGDVSNPKTLNAVLPAGIEACETSWVFPRAPDIGLFRIWQGEMAASAFSDVYVINNHFKSGPDSCVAHRTEQANYNAALVSFLQNANPNARIVVGGDLNVYPRPDDPFAPIGQSGSSDQLGALYDPSLGLTNLWEDLLSQAPQAAYSYVYQGQAQTLDQMFVNQPMLDDLQQFQSAHINSDFPADYTGDGARGTSDHDPQVAVDKFTPVTFDDLVAMLNGYADGGQVTGNNTFKALMDHLDKAASYQASGKDAAYRAQLQAFINQVQGKAPQFVTQDAADALSGEATALLNMP